MRSGALLHSAIWSRMKICRRKVSSVVWLWAIRSGSVLTVAPCGVWAVSRMRPYHGRLWSRARLPGVGGDEQSVIIHQIVSVAGLRGVDPVFLAQPQVAHRLHGPAGQLR